MGVNATFSHFFGQFALLGKEEDGARPENG